jgi:DamX protein
VTGDDTYALQLMGFYSFQDLVDYAARVDLPDRVYYREETYRGRPWFVLIHSLHPSLAAATEERSRLPPRLAGLDIWVRPLREGMQLQVLGTSGGR